MTIGNANLFRAAVLGALGLALPLAVFALNPGSDPRPPEAKAPLTCLFGKTEPAKNPVRMSLQADDTKVVGWISGTTSYAGKTVTITVNGKSDDVAVAKDNTFSWNYRIAKPTNATFMLVCEGIQQKIALSPAVEQAPTVFFVVDRSAYRPTQTLNFAGFLRQLDSKGEFVPLTKRTVEVQLASERKNTVAAKLKLDADDFGRVVGSYTFSDADALDNYNLSIVGYKGTAKVYLGEYRKSKVKLKIDGQVADAKLKLSFQAVDFLEKPVAGSNVSFIAQVVSRTAKEKKYTLKGEEFAYYSAAPVAQIDFEELPEDELLLWEAEGTYAPSFSPRGSTVVAQVTGQVDLKEKEPGEYCIDMKKEWLAGNCTVIVQAVVVDANGREQRASQSIALEAVKKRTVQIEACKRYFGINDPIEVTARPVDEQGKPLAGSTTLVAMRLTAAAETAIPNYYNDFLYSNYRRVNVHGALLVNRPRPDYTWTVTGSAENAKRTLATAVALRDGSGTLKLSEPGAYKLVAITTLADGSKVQNEVGVVVRNSDDLPPVVLRLDKDEFAAGEKLTGAIHSRFADARLLLTIRDSNGIRFTKPLQLKDGVLALSENLPADLKYGCAVDVAYFDEEKQIHNADKFVRIAPTNRMVTIEAKTKETYQPGESVHIDLQVNRKEAVDLVVSVFDQSLLGIAPDRSIDIRNFYLADERVRFTMARESMRRKLADQTIDELVDRAKYLVKKWEGADPAQERQAMQNLGHNYGRKLLTTADVATLLHLAGLDVRPNWNFFMNYGGNWWHQLTGDELAKLTMMQLLDKVQGEWRLGYQVQNNTVILAESYANNVYYRNRFWNGNMYQSANNWGFQQQAQYLARGDAFRSLNASGNSSHSVEGQGFVSHMPPQGAAPVEMLNTDSDQAHISVRRDFSDAAFWNAKVRTDSEGRASVDFKLPDSLTNWQVVVTAVSKDMHVGQAKARFRTLKPIMVWPMIPRVYTEGDTILLFGTVHNMTDEPQDIRVKLKADNGEVVGREETTVHVAAKTNVPVYWTFKPGKAGFTQLLMTADCKAGSDASLKRLPVVRAGADQIITASGFCKDGVKLDVPKNIDLNSAQLDVTFAPSLAADLADTLNYLVEYPYGCVEQTMSRFLPAIKVAQVLQQFHVNHPELNKKLPGCVAGGIKRLLELQQPDGGWGWHGNTQTHEMMTPYALYGLLQAEKAGYTIPNDGAVNRGLDRLNIFIQQMNEAQTADRIYCMYVFSHRRDLLPEWWKFIEEQLGKDKLSDYALALSLEMAVQKDRKPLAIKLSDALHARAQKSNGRTFWQTAGFSRWGDDKFEVTAAVMKALVAHDKDDPMIDGILGFFAATKRGDRWNSTKDTAMILYAMCDYLAKVNYRPETKSTVTFTLNGGDSRKISFEDGLTRKLTIAGKELRHGENQIKTVTDSPGIMYRVVLRYWQAGADVEPMDKGLKVKRNFYLLDSKGQRTRELKSGEAVPRGSYIESEVLAESGLRHNMQYVLVENPKPSCAEILPVDDPRFAGNQVSTPHVLREERLGFVAYHHEQTPPTIQDRCVMLVELAGDYVVAPANVEMMYQTETRGHSGSFILKVVEGKK